MFGFLRPSFSLLTEEEKEDYQRYFCGLCLALKAKYGFFGPFLNNYEGTFAFILLSALSGSEEKMETVRCPFLPFRRKIIYKGERHLKLIISLIILFITEKLKDDVEDDRSFLAYVFYLFLSGKYREAKENLKNLNFPLEKLDLRKREQFLVEKKSFVPVGSSSLPFSSSLSDLFTYMGKTSHNNIDLSGAGYELGRLIYLYDAYKDFSGDLRKKRFNALLAGYPALKKYRKLTVGVRSDIKRYLTLCVFKMREELKKIPSGNRKRLIENILIESVMERIKRI